MCEWLVETTRRTVPFSVQVCFAVQQSTAVGEARQGMVPGSVQHTVRYAEVGVSTAQNVVPGQHRLYWLDNRLRTLEVLRGNL